MSSSVEGSGGRGGGGGGGLHYLNSNIKHGHDISINTSKLVMTRNTTLDG